MERNFRKSVAFLIALTMLLASAGFSFAAEPPSRTAIDKDADIYRWEGLNTVTGTLEILSGGKANPIVRGTVYTGKVDYVNVAVSLKQRGSSGWSTIKSWNRDITVSLNQFTFNETYQVSRNYAYKYTATVKSYKDGVLADTVTFDSKIVSY
jgi:hypothetical protein